MKRPARRYTPRRPPEAAPGTDQDAELRKRLIRLTGVQAIANMPLAEEVQATMQRERDRLEGEGLPLAELVARLEDFKKQHDWSAEERAAAARDLGNGRWVRMDGAIGITTPGEW